MGEGNQKNMPFIFMEGIKKTFPGITALDNVNFSLNQGEIHALLGENGAGKSTLMKILAGMYQATEGNVYMEGKPVFIHSPEDALKLGIGMVYQNFTLSPELTVLENILLGSSIPFFINPRDLEKKVVDIIQDYGLLVDLHAKVWQLSVGEQQRVEILKCFYRGAKILILDEPTSVLTPPETNELFKMMKKAVSRKCAIVFISHKLNEVMDIADRITVFRKGKRLDSLYKNDATVETLSRLMVGRNVDLGQRTERKASGKCVLKIEGICAKNDKGIQALDSVSLQISEREILGIAAVSGNGQAELAEVISGLRKATAGSVSLDTGQQLHQMNARQIILAGVSHISENRLGCSLIPGFSIEENLISKDYRTKKFKTHGVFNRKKIRSYAKELIEKYDVAAPDTKTMVRVLSGGNVQKVVLSRELSRKPKVILAVNPTYGLDVGAIDFVQQRLCEQREEGAAILLISEELDEVLRLSDRIVVMHKGKIMATLDSDEFDREKIGLLMTGGSGDVYSDDKKK